MTLTAERLRELLSYDPETGVFVWRCKVGQRGKPGDVAGHKTTSGYLSLQVDGQKYQQHRLAWLWVHGRWPTPFIDHINGNRTDNRLANLREVTKSENCQNQRRAHRGSASGLLGVRQNHKKWAAKIRVGGKELYLGSFETPEAAHEAYIEAKRREHTTNTL